MLVCITTGNAAETRDHVHIKLISLGLTTESKSLLTLTLMVNGSGFEGFYGTPLPKLPLSCALSPHPPTLLAEFSCVACLSRSWFFYARFSRGVKKPTTQQKSPRTTSYYKALKAMQERNLCSQARVHHSGSISKLSAENNIKLLHA